MTGITNMSLYIIVSFTAGVKWLSVPNEHMDFMGQVCYHPRILGFNTGQSYVRQQQQQRLW